MNFSKKELVQIVEKASSITDRMGIDFLGDEDQQDDEIINSRFENWCQVSAQGRLDLFEHRLALDNLDFSKIRRILGHVRLTNKLHLPKWTETLNEALQATSLLSVEEIKVKTTGKNSVIQEKDPIPFEELFLPFIHVARQKIITKVTTSYYLLSEEAHTSLKRNLLHSLSYVCSQAMEFEFSVFRACRKPTVSRIFGQSPDRSSQKQYRDFIRDMLGGGLLSFFFEYSVLAKLVSTITDLWVDATVELIERLEFDWLEIQETFNPEVDLGQVVAIEPSLSDRHNNGRSVMALTFISGLKLIYKPKNLDLEKAYFQLLGWFNTAGFPLTFKLLKVINRSTYGWVEFVKAVPCTNQEEARRYYQRAGVLLCLVYVLEGTDCHLENLIACGEHPILIDLETLLHHRVQSSESPEDYQDALYLANQQLWHSVLRTGLLPQSEFDPDGQSYDATGLGGVSEQETRFRTLKWYNINTDRMTLIEEYAKTKPQSNVPSINGVNLSPNDYVKELVDGFRQMYYFLVKDRQAIIDEPLRYLEQQQVRFVFRPTQIYRSILHKVLKPKFLRNGVDRSIQLDVLSRVLLLSSSPIKLWSLTRAEQQALEQLDIPTFTSSSDSKDLFISSTKVENCFTEPSYVAVISRLKKLNDEDLEQQIDLIQGSLYSRIASEAHSQLPSVNSDFNFDAVVPLRRIDLVNEAVTIAKNIQKRAICSADGAVTWIALKYIIEAQRYQLQPMDYSLYEGCCGVSFFLAALEKVTGDAGFRILALGALQPLRKDLLESSSEEIAKRIGIGGATGCGGIIYALVRISEFLESPELLEDAKQAASLMTSNLITTSQSFDVISGVAGAILGLLTLHNISPNSEVIEQAIICGNYLLSNRVTSDLGYRTWTTSDRKLLTGFSHGAAGIAYALLRLYQATGEDIFLEAAQEAFAYEHSVFVPDVCNLPDFRSPLRNKSFTYGYSWCHGAPGIGLARIAGLDILDTDEIRQDIEAAVNVTRQLSLQDVDHLCCGNLGRVEFLFYTARKLSQSQLLETAMEQATLVVARAKQRGAFAVGLNWNSGPYYSGLFQGAAGIGYELLRLAYPDQLPSVLLWE